MLQRNMYGLTHLLQPHVDVEVLMDCHRWAAIGDSSDGGVGGDVAEWCGFGVVVIMLSCCEVACS